MALYAVEENRPMEQRIEFALRAMRALNFRALCQEYGISAKSGYKWKERFLREGVRGMEEESRRPRSSPEQLPEEVMCEIVRLKLAHLSWGTRKIRELYLRGHGEVASESTFKRILERVGLTQKRRGGDQENQGKSGSDLPLSTFVRLRQSSQRSEGSNIRRPLRHVAQKHRLWRSTFGFGSPR